MGMFGKKPSAGGFMDEIRCDESSYLIWKWHPVGSKKGNNNRENAIRWGSSLRVKEGEAAVFVYSHNDELTQEFIIGPFDKIIETDNLPVISSILGLAYDGGTPFQAEIYFINLAKIIQISFAVPYFDVFDYKYKELSVPVAVHGKLTFNIVDCEQFIRLHRLTDFDLDEFKSQIKDALIRYTKGVVINVPTEKNIPVIQIEREIISINESIESEITQRFEKDFGIKVVAVDISTIDVDKSSEGYKQLKSVTQDVTVATIQAQTQADIKNIQDMQEIKIHDLEENMRIEREEKQYARHKQTQSEYLSVYEKEQQAEVAKKGAEALGQMGNNSATEISGDGGMNPTAMMSGMMMAGTIGKNMSEMMNDMMTEVNDGNKSMSTEEKKDSKKEES